MAVESAGAALVRLGGQEGNLGALMANPGIVRR
jgi:hypothetical protein